MNNDLHSYNLNIFVDTLKLLLGYEYNINVIKEFKGTESFLAMSESSRNCQNLESQKVTFVNVKCHVFRTSFH